MLNGGKAWVIHQTGNLSITESIKDFIWYSRVPPGWGEVLIYTTRADGEKSHKSSFVHTENDYK